MQDEELDDAQIELDPELNAITQAVIGAAFASPACSHAYEFVHERRSQGAEQQLRLLRFSSFASPCA